MNFNSEICRRTFLRAEGGEQWIRIRVRVSFSNTGSKVFTVGRIINNSSECTYLSGHNKIFPRRFVMK